MAYFTTHTELVQAMCICCGVDFMYQQSSLWRCGGSTIWFVEMRWKCGISLTDVVDLRVHMP